MATLPPTFGTDMFGPLRTELSKLLGENAEEALMEANFLLTTDYTAFRAISYYITFLFEDQHSSKATAIVGTALAIAVRVHLQRDPSEMIYAVDALMAEARRRIWHCLHHSDPRGDEAVGHD